MFVSYGFGSALPTPAARRAFTSLDVIDLPWLPQDERS